VVRRVAGIGALAYDDTGSGLPLRIPLAKET